MKYRVVVCSCLDAGILVAAQCTNTSLMRLEEEVMSSLHSHRETKPPISPHWTHLLIDEVRDTPSNNIALTFFRGRQRRVLNQNFSSRYPWFSRNQALKLT